MNAQTALCMALLEGRVLNVSNCFRDVGYTNIAREIPRKIEEPFGVEVSRVEKEGKNRYGTPTKYTDYRLNSTPYNIEGIKKMEEFVKKNGGECKTRLPVGRPKTKAIDNSNDKTVKLF